MMRLGLYHHGDTDWFYNLPPEKQRDVTAVLIADANRNKPQKKAPARRLSRDEAIGRMAAKQDASTKTVQFWKAFAE